MASESLPTTVASAPKSTSVSKFISIYLKAVFFMMFLYGVLIVTIGVVLWVASSANHISHLVGYWGFMAGASGASLFLGSYSAWKHGKWIKFGRVTLLVSFLVQVTGGLAILSLARTSAPSSLVIAFMVPLGSGTILGFLYLLNLVYLMAVTEAAGPGQAQEATDEHRDSIRLADFTHWVADMAAQLSGARGQASTSHEMSVLGDQGKRLWLSHMIRRQRPTPESPPSEEQEPLLSNLDLASDVV